MCKILKIDGIVFFSTQASRRYFLLVIIYIYIRQSMCVRSLKKYTIITKTLNTYVSETDKHCWVLLKNSKTTFYSFRYHLLQFMQFFFQVQFFFLLPLPKKTQEELKHERKSLHQAYIMKHFSKP